MLSETQLKALTNQSIPDYYFLYWSAQTISWFRFENIETIQIPNVSFTV